MDGNSIHFPCCIEVLSDAYTAADNGHATLPDFLDLSAAFDTVDQVVLEHLYSVAYIWSCRLHAQYNWVSSYLSVCKVRLLYCHIQHHGCTV